MGDNIKPLTESDNWCKTIVGETIKSSFIWTIEGFNNRPEENDEYLDSNTFKICDPEGKVSTWYLTLYPRGDPTDDGNHVSLGLVLEDDFTLKIDYELFILDSSSCKQHVFEVKSEEFNNNEPLMLLHTVPIRCQDMYFMSNLNFYIAKTPCQYDKKEIFMQLGFVSGPSFFRFRN